MSDLQDALARTRQLAKDKRVVGETVVADALDGVLAQFDWLDYMARRAMWDRANLLMAAEATVKQQPGGMAALELTVRVLKSGQDELHQVSPDPDDHSQGD